MFSHWFSRSTASCRNAFGYRPTRRLAMCSPPALCQVCSFRVSQSRGSVYVATQDRRTLNHYSFHYVLTDIYRKSDVRYHLALAREVIHAETSRFGAGYALVRWRRGSGPPAISPESLSISQFHGSPGNFQHDWDGGSHRSVFPESRHQRTQLRD